MAVLEIVWLCWIFAGIISLAVWISNCIIRAWDKVNEKRTTKLASATGNCVDVFTSLTWQCPICDCCTDLIQHKDYVIDISFPSEVTLKLIPREPLVCWCPH